MEFDDSRIRLDELSLRLPPGLITVRVEGAPDRRLRNVVIAAPDDLERPDTAVDAASPLADIRDAALLAVGARGHAAVDLVQAAGAAGAALVILRGAGAATAAVQRAVVAVPGLALWELAPDASWSETSARLTALIEPTPQLVADDQLSAFAQTVATLTGGLVTIEDRADRVLAYSASTAAGDDVDELRRLSILGRSGPAQYLALLRELGVFTRLATPDEVVEVAEDPVSGMRRRLAIGLFAAGQQLGTIWVQEGAEPLRAEAPTALVGAARVGAATLVGGLGLVGAAAESRFAAVLGGRAPSFLGWSARAAARPCAVVVIALDDDGQAPPAFAQWGQSVTNLIRLHAVALRQRALVTQLGPRLFVLLPDVDRLSDVVPAVEAALGSARRLEGGRLRAAIGRRASSLAELDLARATAEAALELTDAGPLTNAAPLAVFDQLRPRLLVERVVAGVREEEQLRDPRVTEFLAREPQQAETLRRYLDSGSDVAAVAAGLDVHATTVRYRLNQAVSELGLDLADPATRLALQLQLWAELGPT